MTQNKIRFFGQPAPKKQPSLSLWTRLIAPLLFWAFSLVPLSAQQDNADLIKWTFDFSKKEYQIGDEIEVILKAKIKESWYLYSTDFDPALGPIVSEFNFKPQGDYELIGKIKPMAPKKKYDDLWGGEYTYFTKTAEFRQKIKVLKPLTTIVVEPYFQVCSDETGMCILNAVIEGSKKFNIATKNLTLKSDTKQETTQNSTETSSEKEVENKAENSTQADTEGEKFAPLDTISVEENGEGKQNSNFDNQSTSKNPTLDLNPTFNQEATQESIWGFILASFIGGVLALLTPCVFPMIPMTVAFFTKRSRSRAKAIVQGLIYALSIIAFFTLIGVGVGALLGEDAANFLSTHWFPNLFFFTLFIIFAISFFGAFEITLPSFIVNKMDAQADKNRGLGGIFFMAITLVLVSFSCTAPIVGSLLVMAADGQFLRPALGMASFGAAFALPFSLFAIFPSWLSSLPKSGGWLNTVKVVLGFIELALAFKFLSVADQVYHWGLLDRHIFIAIWAAISFLTGLYLLGKIRLPHDSAMEKLSITRLLLATVAFGFFLYLLPGLWGAPLKELSGYLPPQKENMFAFASNGTTSQTAKEESFNAKYADFLHLPHGIKGYFEYKEALAAAEKAGKPLFIDFTGHGCVNCRKMEANVWADAQVLRALKEDFVVVALYADERKEAEQSDWVQNAEGETLKTIGSINLNLQSERFKTTSQPYYVIINPKDERLLANPTAYDEKVSNFINFLETAKNNFKILNAAQ
ncbi:protein-disulfide reductase DsbD family protein [Hugenholtzia roseola]|uniref:protein-disulfide reductase DsbD family protein n=1 Tax=Hugenholtzia roseola TaxID=1002 RepID=UPI000401670F|nr:thioredoxin family protein [Hugenholtzia roseola]